MNVTERFLAHRQVTEQLCRLMPDGRFEFRPYEGAMSFGELATHLAISADWFLAFADGTAFTWPPASEQPSTPEAIRQYLAERSVAQAERMSALNGDLERVVDFRGKEVTVAFLLAALREHEAHHKGQMMLLARMCGLTDKLFYTA